MDRGPDCGNDVETKLILGAARDLCNDEDTGASKSCMTESGKEVARAAAVAGVGASVGGAGGGTVGVLELASQGAATGLSAGLAIGVGAAAGAVLFLLGYKALKNRKKSE